MSKLTRKFVAVLMLLWLPLSGASAFAATISMQMQRGAGHEAAMQEMQHADAGEHQHHCGTSDMQDQAGTQEHGDSTCNACGVCHLACSGYLAVPAVAAPEGQASAPLAAPYRVSFHSVVFTPLLPPPLARA